MSYCSDRLNPEYIRLTKVFGTRTAAIAAVQLNGGYEFGKTIFGGKSSLYEKCKLLYGDLADIAYLSIIKLHKIKNSFTYKQSQLHELLKSQKYYLTDSEEKILIDSNFNVSKLSDRIYYIREMHSNNIVGRLEVQNGDFELDGSYPAIEFDDLSIDSAGNIDSLLMAHELILHMGSYVKIVDIVPSNIFESEKYYPLKTKNKIYGYFDKYTGEIGLTIDGLNGHTPIHEYTHLWALSYRFQYPDKWGELANLIRNTPEYKSKYEYDSLTDDFDAISEILAVYTENNKLLQESEKFGNAFIDRLKTEILNFWNSIFNKSTHTFTSLEEVSNAVLYDLVNKSDLPLPSDFTIDKRIKNFWSVTSEQDLIALNNGHDLSLDLQGNTSPLYIDILNYVKYKYPDISLDKQHELAKIYKSKIYSLNFTHYFGAWMHKPLIDASTVIWGHPATGKTYLYKNNSDKIIDFDSEYKPKVNQILGLPEGADAKELRKLIRKTKKLEYNNALYQLFLEAKNEAERTGKKLLVSDLFLLKEHADELDVITFIDNYTFVERNMTREETSLFNSTSWKLSINTAMNSLSLENKHKIIYYNGFIQDLINISTAVYSNGEPKLMFHGSGENFNFFNPNLAKTRLIKKDYTTKFRGILFSNSLAGAINWGLSKEQIVIKKYIYHKNTEIPEYDSDLQLDKNDILNIFYLYKDKFKFEGLSSEEFWNNIQKDIENFKSKHIYAGFIFTKTENIIPEISHWSTIDLKYGYDLIENNSDALFENVQLESNSNVFTTWGLISSPKAFKSIENQGTFNIKDDRFNWSKDETIDQDTKDILSLIKYQYQILYKDPSEFQINFEKVVKGYLSGESWAIEKVRSLVDKVQIRQAQLHVLGYDYNEESYDENGEFNWTLYLGGIDLNDEIEEITGENVLLFSKLENYQVDPAEIIMPKLYRSQFHLGNRSLSEIDKSFFKKANSFYYSDLKHISKNGVIDSEPKIDFLVRCHNYKFNIIASDSLSIPPTDKLKPIEVEVVDGYRIKNGERMYKLPEKSKYQIYRDSKGNETVVIKNSESTENDIKSLIESLEIKDLVSVQAFLENLEPTKDLLRYVINVNNIKAGNSDLKRIINSEMSSDEIREELLLIYYKNSDVYKDELGRYPNKYKEELSEVLYNSFLKTLEVISVRIPTQAFLSIMAARVIGLTDDESNNVFVNRWQFWLLGSKILNNN